MAKGAKKNNNETENSEEQEQVSTEEKNRLRAERDAKSDESFKQLGAGFKKFWWVALILVGLFAARIIYLRMKNDAQMSFHS